jgi:hypothetical protein
MKTTIITTSLDLLAGFDFLLLKEQMHVLLSVVDTLGSYTKPTKKRETTPIATQKLNAYLFVSNVRNACKLGVTGAITPTQAHETALSNLEMALTELLK